MKRKKAVTLTTAALALTMAVCGSSTAIAASELTAESKPATQYTIDANQEVYALLDFEDTEEFENATKGLIASPDTGWLVCFLLLILMRQLRWNCHRQP